MKAAYVFLIALAILLQSVHGDILGVMDFCSALQSDGASKACRCKPGKIGPEGSRGSKGEKGESGSSGLSDDLEKRLKMLEETVASMKKTGPDDMEDHCLMGMKSGKIPDAAITALTTYKSTPKYKVNQAYYGRLDNRRSSLNRGCWIAGESVLGEWIQVDLGTIKLVAGVVTQGRPDYIGNQWTETYKVSCGPTESTLTTITEKGKEKIFTANRDRDTKVANLFPGPMACRYIRLYPQTWFGHMTLRMDLINGECFDLLSAVQMYYYI